MNIIFNANMKTTITRRNASAFSLIELLTGVAVISVLGSIAVSLIINPIQSMKMSKLEQDTSQLNSAVQVFLSSGGRLDEASTAQEVIDELKRAVDAGAESEVVGLRGSLVDPRLVAFEESGGEVRPRAIWFASIGKFMIEEGPDGVREFRLDGTPAGEEPGGSQRETSVAYNGGDGWIWNAADFASGADRGLLEVPTTGVPTPGGSGSSSSTNNTKLHQPLVSPGAGTFALMAFPLQVTLTKHPADPEDTIIYYSTASNAWSLYEGPISIDPGTHLQAYATNRDPAWVDSDLVAAGFHNDPVALELAIDIPKNPLSYAEAGGAIEPGNYAAVAPVAPITVTLANADSIPAVYQHSGNFRIQWSYDGSDPLASPAGTSPRFSGGYPGDSIDYSLPHWEGASLLPIRIAAGSSNASVATDSVVERADIRIARTNLPPALISWETEFLSDESFSNGLVELVKYVDSGEMPVGARIYYTTDGIDPGDDGNGNPLVGTLYTGRFDPTLNQQFASNSVIIARVYPPVGLEGWFNVSSPSGADYAAPAWSISGEASGWFSSPEGPSGMVSNLEGSETNSYFQWGDPGDWGTGANWTRFEGTSFNDVSRNDRFLVGTLDYYNGTISMSSLATKIDFSVELAFAGATRRFDYSFDLLTTPNTGTEWENADYVWFNDTQSSQSVNLYGIEYSLNLEFGETSTYGFSSIDQFHVQEAREGSADVYATLVSLDSWW